MSMAMDRPSTGLPEVLENASAASQARFRLSLGRNPRFVRMDTPAPEPNSKVSRSARSMEVITIRSS